MSCGSLFSLSSLCCLVSLQLERARRERRLSQQPSRTNFGTKPGRGAFLCVCLPQCNSFFPCSSIPGGCSGSQRASTDGRARKRENETREIEVPKGFHQGGNLDILQGAFLGKKSSINSERTIQKIVFFYPRDLLRGFDDPCSP